MTPNDLRNKILDRARQVFLSRKVPVLTGHPNKDKPFRVPNDEGPVGFRMGKVDFEVHFVGEKKATLHGIEVRVPMVDVLIFNMRGDSRVYASKVEVFPCV
jgi:hypothetical protein